MKKMIPVRKSARRTFRPSLECLETRLTPSTYTVANLADSGPGSLRAAITSVNGDTTPDIIDFSVAGVIKLTSGALPAITNTVKIDGTTAPGFSPPPLVEIDNNGFAGLTIAAPNSTLTTLSIVNANGPGVTLEADNITVVGDWIGLASDGSVAPNTGAGLFVDHSRGDTIGGTGPATANFISGNGGGGIQLGTSGSEQFVQSASILSNNIGTSGSGTGAAGNQGNGITVFSTANTIGGTARGAANTIAFNTGAGVVVNGGTQNAIQGNSIFSNTGPGIQLLNNGNHNQPAPVMTGSYLDVAGHGIEGPSLLLSGRLKAAPNTQYVLDYFSTPPEIPGVGEAYLRSQTVTTDADGVAIFTSPQVGTQFPDVAFTATATNTSTNDTSAFSNAIALGTTQPAFVENAYQLLLNRQMDGDAPYWVNGLESGALTPVTAVLGMESSLEYVRDQVIGLYSRYLDRVADQQGIQYWTDFVLAGGTFEQVAAGLTSSQEYFVLKGGTNQGFVSGLYHDVLNRDATDAEIAGWVAALNAGASRQTVSVAFLTSQEYRTDLVKADYMTFLKRPADDGGLAVWLNALNAGATDQEVLAEIFGSPEGYQVWS